MGKIWISMGKIWLISHFYTIDWLLFHLSLSLGFEREYRIPKRAQKSVSSSKLPCTTTKSMVSGLHDNAIRKPSYPFIQFTILISSALFLLVECIILISITMILLLANIINVVFMIWFIVVECKL